jgi:hypothetical protein
MKIDTYAGRVEIKKRMCTKFWLKNFVGKYHLEDVCMYVCVCVCVCACACARVRACMHVRMYEINISTLGNVRTVLEFGAFVRI